MDVRVRYCGRPESSSPATGSYGRHKAEQEYLLKDTFSGNQAVVAGANGSLLCPSPHPFR